MAEVSNWEALGRSVRGIPGMEYLLRLKRRYDDEVEKLRAQTDALDSPYHMDPSERDPYENIAVNTDPTMMGPANQRLVPPDFPPTPGTPRWRASQPPAPPEQVSPPTSAPISEEPPAEPVVPRSSFSDRYEAIPGAMPGFYFGSQVKKGDTEGAKAAAARMLMEGPKFIEQERARPHEPLVPTTGELYNEEPGVIAQRRMAELPDARYFTPEKQAEQEFLTKQQQMIDLGKQIENQGTLAEAQAKYYESGGSRSPGSQSSAEERIIERIMEERERYGGQMGPYERSLRRSRYRPGGLDFGDEEGGDMAPPSRPPSVERLRR